MQGAKVEAFGTQQLQSRGQIDCQVFRSAAQDLLDLVNASASKKIPVSAPQVTRALQLLGTQRVSAKSTDKSDFHATVRSQGTQYTHGFSLKSQIAGSSSLINASKDSTYFEFEILKNGKPADKTDIQNILAASGPGYDFLVRAKQAGYDLIFTATAPTLEYSLRVMDTCGPELIAALLLEELARREKNERSAPTLAELTARVARRAVAAGHPIFSRFGQTEDEIRCSLEYKVKGILLAFSAGATPGTKWNGLNTTEGGILIVKKNGKVVCLQLSSRNAVGDYLLHSCRFETPSTIRHVWGSPYFQGNRCFVRIQLQVRFTA